MSAQDPVPFVVGTLEFELAPLPLKDQMKGWSVVGGLVLPIFAGGGKLNTEALQAALAGLDRIGELFDMFARVAKVQWQTNGKVPVSAFADNVFARRSDLILGFLSECIFAEYGSFLDESGQAVLSKVGDRFASLLA